jgi:hypothetical protein
VDEGGPGVVSRSPSASLAMVSPAVPVGVCGIVGHSVLSLNGFSEDAYGQLGWHPAVDLPVAAVLAAALALGSTLRQGADRRPSGELSNWSQELEPEDGDR